MNRTLIVILLIFAVIIILVTMQLNQFKKNSQEVRDFNNEYEKYKNKDLYGIDVVTVINKAVDNNTKNNIEKDEKGIYIENEANSIKVELSLIASADEKTGEKKLVTHQMERIIEVGLDGFIKNFNLTIFRVKEINYHEKTGRISKIIFEQMEE